MAPDSVPADDGLDVVRVVLIVGCVAAAMAAATLIPAISGGSGGLAGSPAETLLPGQQAPAGQAGENVGLESSDSLARSGESGLGALNPGEQTGVGGDIGFNRDTFGSNDTEVHFVVDSSEPAYWRTGAYDVYTGTGWEQSGESEPYEEPLEHTGYADQQVEYEVTLKRPASSLPTVWRPRKVSGVDGLSVTDTGAIQSRETLSAGTTFTGVSRTPERDVQLLRASGQSYPEDIERRYTQLPADTPDRVGAFTAELTSDDDNPYETAVTVQQWLRSNKTYSLQASQQSDHMADTFIFEMERGYCEYFATAMVTMLRSQDIPARYTVGYSTGQPTGDGTYEVRSMNAHAWVEVYFEDVGWVRFDPTPGNDRLASQQAALDQQNIDRDVAQEQGSPGEQFDPNGTSQERPGGTGTSDEQSGANQQDDQQPGDQQPGDQSTDGTSDQQDGSDGSDGDTTDEQNSSDEGTDGEENSSDGDTTNEEGSSEGGTNGEEDSSEGDTTDEQNSSDDDTSDEESSSEDETGGEEDSSEDNASDEEGSSEGGTDGEENSSEDNTSDDEETGTVDYETSLNRTAVPGATVEVTVTQDGEPAVDREVLFNGDSIGRTDQRGRVTGTVPYEEELRIAVADRREQFATVGRVPQTADRVYAVTEATGDGLAAAAGISAVEDTYPVETNATVTVSGEPLPGESVVVTALVEDVPVSAATVTVAGESVNRTDENGRAVVTLPEASGNVTIGVERGPVSGERTVTVPDLSLSVDSTLPIALPSTGATVDVSAGETAVVDAPVRVDGEQVATTGPDGTATVRLPLANAAVVGTTAHGLSRETTVSGLFRNLALVGSLLVVGIAASLGGLARLGYGPRRLLGLLVGLPARVAHGVQWLLVTVMTRGDVLVRQAVARLRQTALSLLALARGDITPRELRDRFERWLAAQWERFRGGAATDANEQASPGTAEKSAPEVTVREAWEQFLRATSVRRVPHRTPGELARHAIEEDNLPPDAVRTLRDVFREVEYGSRSAEDRVERVQRAISDIEGARQRGEE